MYNEFSEFDGHVAPREWYELPREERARRVDEAWERITHQLIGIYPWLEEPLPASHLHYGRYFVVSGFLGGDRSRRIYHLIGLDENKDVFGIPDPQAYGSVPEAQCDLARMVDDSPTYQRLSQELRKARAPAPLRFIRWLVEL